MLRIADQGVISHQPGRGAYMPVVTPLPDGTCIACQHVGAGLGADDNHIEVLRSADGRTWQNEGSIHRSRETGQRGLPGDGYAYRGPRLDAVPDGRLVMSATRFETAA
ncbi:MAG: hypothetical protein ABIL09_06035, partial [Gemmatimonadota bacterium]